MIIERQDINAEAQAEQPYDKFVVAMRNTLAKKNAMNIMGNGITFSSPDKKLVDKFRDIDRYTNFDELFYDLEKEISLVGRAILIINKDNEGEIRINKTDVRYLNGVAKVFYINNLAVVYQRVVLDNASYVVKSVVDNKEVNNTFYSGEYENGKLQDIIVLAETKELEKKLAIPKKWVHNLGFLPIIEMTNLPIRQNFWNPSQFITLADWYYAQQFEQTAWSILKNLEKELEYNHSRIIVENASQEIIQSLRYANQNSSIANVFGDYIIEGENGANIKVQAGVPDLNQYNNAFISIMNLYYKFSGSSAFAVSGGAQKTSAETSSMASETQEMNTFKIKNRIRVVSDLLAKCFHADGLMDYYGDWNFEVKIQGNLQKDETVYMDNLIKQIQIGVISIPEAISQLRGISSEAAKIIFEEISKFNEENDITTTGDADGEADGDGEKKPKDDKGGAPEKKKDTKDE